MSRAMEGLNSWIRHECRLVFRETQLSFGTIAAFLGAGVIVAGYVMMHAVAYLFLQYLDETGRGTRARLDGLLLVLLFSATWVRGIAISQRMLFGRGDTKLLLCSPIRIAQVLRARALMLAAASVAFPLLVLSPAANVAFLLGRPGMLTLYPMALSIAVVASLLAVTVTACSRRWLGNAGTQAVARVTVIGVLLLALASKLPSLSGLMDRLGVHLEDAATWMGTSLAGNPVPLYASLAASALGGCLLPRFLAAIYLSGLHERPSGSRAFRTRPESRLAVSGRLTRLLAKDCRLVWRNPAQLAQAGLSALVIAVAVATVGRNQPIADGRLLTAALVCALGAFGAEVGWLVTSGEQAPWLLASAPLSRHALWMVRWLSALSVALPALPVIAIGLMFYQPVDVVPVLAFGTGALSMSLLLTTSAPVSDVPRGGRGRRRNGLLSAASMASYGCWAAAAVASHGFVSISSCLALGALALGVSASLGFHGLVAGGARRRPRGA